MLSATAPDFPESKINRLVENVVCHLEPDRTDTRHADDLLPTWASTRPRGDTRPTMRSSRNSSPHGIPREQIAAIGDAESDAKKQALFEKVRQGSVRVLIGSTQKMGTGTNVQKRLVALHHLDAPWKPAEVEQREGRILRQGNENEEVAIYRYVTEGSFDAYMWVRRESRLLDCVATPRGFDHTCGSVRRAYRHMRCQQWQGMKLSRQRTPTHRVQSGTARCALSC